MIKNKPTVTIYTEGACKGNPGLGGWGAVLRSGETEKHLKGGEKNTTNNRMEMLALISGLRYVKEMKILEKNYFLPLFL